MREMGRIEEDSISPTTVDRMVSYMARHEGDKQGASGGCLRQGPPGLGWLGRRDRPLLSQGTGSSTG
jgi:hypothetical protein